MRDRAVAAPISWGVSEVPGWGHQMPIHRVLAEMRALGLAVTELGPPGFLPGGSAERAALLDRYGLRVIGGFIPVVLHDPDADPQPALARIAAEFATTGIGVLVLAADLGKEGYDEQVEVDPAGWRAMLANLDRAAAIAADHGLIAALHPHVGTAVERPAQVERVLSESEIALCLDTGHYLVGGGDPAELVATGADRIAHVHLKDADLELAARVRTAELGYADAVTAELYRPLGQGAARIADVVGRLESAGYCGWYVLEQDVRLDREPDRQAGPIGAVRASLDYLAALEPERPAGPARGR
ncbi:MAG TPA: TIM barrel protein [Actinomycetes bacterium]|nr:TIM barrel protein [Actinomycetes bacterium]